MQKARCHTDCTSALQPLVSVWFQGLFTPLLRVLFTFPLQYLFAIGLPVVFRLTRWCWWIQTEFHRLRPTQDTAKWHNYFTYGTFTPCGVPSQDTSVIIIPSTAQSYNPCEHAHRFGLFRFRSPLLAESLLVFFSSSYLDVSVQRVNDFSSYLQYDRLPHSDINGLTVVCTSPLLFAAYHVLRRLREPRHPPYALISLPSLTNSYLTIERQFLSTLLTSKRSHGSIFFFLLNLYFSGNQITSVAIRFITPNLVNELFQPVFPNSQLNQSDSFDDLIIHRFNCILYRTRTSLYPLA
jgi:hypothetical protein